MKVNLKIETRRAHGGVNKTTEQRTLLFKPSHIGIQLSDGVYKYTYLSTSEAKLDQISEIWGEGIGFYFSYSIKIEQDITQICFLNIYCL